MKEATVLLNVQDFLLKLAVSTADTKRQFLTLHVTGMDELKKRKVLTALLQVHGLVYVHYVGLTSGLVFVEVSNRISHIELNHAVEKCGLSISSWKSIAS